MTAASAVFFCGIIRTNVLKPDTMKKIDLSLTDGKQVVFSASIDDPIFAGFVITGLIIVIIVVFSLAFIGFKFMCLVGACNVFQPR